MDQLQVSKLMTYLANLYPGKMDYPREDKKETELMEITWLEFLQEIPGPIVNTAVKKYISQGNKWPPTVGEIFKECKKIMEPPELSSVEAWGLVCWAARKFGHYNEGEALANLHPRIIRTLEIMGGFKRVVCEDTQGGWLQKRFEDIYNQFFQAEIETERLPERVKKEIVEIRGRVTKKMVTGRQ